MNYEVISNLTEMSPPTKSFLGRLEKQSLTIYSQLFNTFPYITQSHFWLHFFNFKELWRYKRGRYISKQWIRCYEVHAIPLFF